MPRHLRCLRAAIVVPALVSLGRAADWPQLRGPGQSGVSPETGLAREWSPAGPPVRWTRALGRGYGGAAVHEGEVFVLDRVAPGGEGAVEQDVLRCFDLETGTQKWTFAYAAPAPDEADIRGSLNVPTVDARDAVAVGPCGQVHCISRETRAPRWKADLLRDFGGLADPAVIEAETRTSPAIGWSRLRYRRQPAVPRWGFTQCAVLYHDLVIVAPLTETAGLAALDRGTGAIRWRTEGYLGRNWFCHVTPYLAQLGGRDQVVLIGNRHPAGKPQAVVSGVDAATGAVLWKTLTPRPYNVPIPMPVKIGEDVLLVAGGYRLGAHRLEVRENAGVWSAAFAAGGNLNCTPHLHAPIFHAGHVYAQSFDGYHNRTNAGLMCLTADLAEVWRTGPDMLFENGNAILADGMLIVLNGQTGELNLCGASPAGGPRRLASARVLDAEGGNAWAPMALSRGRLLVRDRHILKCLDLRAGATQR